MSRRWLAGLVVLAACGHSPTSAIPDAQTGPHPGQPDAAPPNLMLLDSELDVGAVEIGKSVQRLVRVENFGTED